MEHRLGAILREENFENKALKNQPVHTSHRKGKHETLTRRLKTPGAIS